MIRILSFFPYRFFDLANLVVVGLGQTVHERHRQFLARRSKLLPADRWEDQRFVYHLLPMFLSPHAQVTVPEVIASSVEESEYVDKAIL
jgi:hypothetical protein